MNRALKLDDEAGRLAALHRYEVLDTPPEAAFDRITALVRRVLNVPICAVSLVDADRQWFKSCIGLAVRGTSRDVSFCAHTILQSEPLSVPDATADSRFADNPLVTGEPFLRSYLGVPLPTPDGYQLGSLCVIDLVPRNFSPDQVEVLRSFAALVADELELRRIAQTDSLTGAATRRGFTREMENALVRIKTRNSPTALIVLDVDHFKQINDTYGHPAGDLVLKQVAEALTSHLRPEDTLGRLGGEEFGILLHDVGIEDARTFAENMRSTLELSSIQFDPLIHVTASFGIATIDGESTTVEHWLELADDAMYMAKRTGRNRCCLAHELNVTAQNFELRRTVS